MELFIKTRIGEIKKIELSQEIPSDLRAESTIGMYHEMPPAEIVGIASQYGIRHLVQDRQPYSQSDVQTAEIMMTRLEHFLSFPSSSILSAGLSGPEQENSLIKLSVHFSRADEKAGVINQVKDELAKLKRSQHFVSEVLLAADELFSNAIYNAPYLGFSHKDGGVPRTKKFGNDPRIRPARLFLASDGVRLVLGCEDSYGSLNPDIVIDRIKTCLHEGADNAIRWTAGGAGLGTYMILRSALAYYVGVLRNQRTVVCCTYTVARSKVDSVRGLHFACKGDRAPSDPFP
ncbi:MAG: hypothetical protein AB7G93_06845 [Bdellovibrionales bacterium]